MLSFIVIPYFQPKVCLKTLKIVGAEVFMKIWILSPSHDKLYNYHQASSLVSSYGAMLLDVMLIEKAFEHITVWNKTNPDLFFSFNMPIASLDILKDYLALIPDKIKFNNKISFEILESSVTTEVIDFLANSNIKLAIDDFGVAYSNIERLFQMEHYINELKLDIIFTKNITNKSCIPTLKFIANLCAELDINSTAEGIEDKEHYLIMLNNNINYGQGFLFSGLLDAEGFQEVIIKKRINNIS